MNIRRIEEKDLPIVLVLEKLLYKDPWNEKNFESEISQNDYAYMYVLEHEGVILGYAGFWLSYEYATITKVSINPAVQRKGLGYYLFSYIMNKAIELGATSFSLEVRESNISAQNLYIKSGYRKEGKRKGYYSDGEDAIVMLLEKGDEHFEQVYIGNRE